MASAFVIIDRVGKSQNSATFDCVLRISYYGAEITQDPGTVVEHTWPAIALPITNSAVQVQNAIAAAVIAHAASIGLTVGNGDVLMAGIARV